MGSKVADAYDQHNMLSRLAFLERGHLLKELPSVAAKRLQEDGSEADKKALALSVVMMMNSSCFRDDRGLAELSRLAVADESMRCAVFSGLGSDEDLLERLLSMDVCGENVVGWLVSIESENSLFRDVFWSKCRQLALVQDLKALGEVDQKEVKIFFTQEGFLFNASVIDE